MLELADEPLAERVLQVFAETFGDTTRVTTASAPGRVNLIGDHTDYNGGFVLPMSINRSAYVAVRPATGGTRAYSIEFDEMVAYDFQDPDIDALPGWARYVAGVHCEMWKAGMIDRPLEIVVDGDVPIGFGLSSSAALEVATASAIEGAVGRRMDPVELVLLCQRVEHEYAGVACGVMDQFASRFGGPNRAILLDCRSLEHKEVDIGASDYAFLVVVTRARRSLAASGYNQRRRECEQALAFFQSREEHITDLRDVGPELVEAARGELEDVLFRRARHVSTENKRVLQAAASLREGDYEQFGRLMYESHASLATDYEVSHPDLDHVVEVAKTISGVSGARMTGAGFGGCAVVLVDARRIAAIMDRIVDALTERAGYTPEIIPIIESNQVRVLAPTPENISK